MRITEIKPGIHYVGAKSLARTIANYDVRRFFNNDNKQQTD